MTARLKSRLWRHHLPLALLSAAIVGLFYVTRSYDDVITRLSFSTAWPALVLLTVTLAIGPWRVLTRKSSALSVDLRRDIGIWAGILGVLHAGVGQCVHLRGRPWLY
jgi:sulfoxide reductase heme-binding subunit YedZ